MTINIKGYDVLIDDEDYILIKDYKWSADPRLGKDAVYFKCYTGGGKKHSKHIYLHRLIAGAREPSRGNNRKNNVVDHKNLNTLDCRKENLRICTHKKNTRNRRGKRGRLLPTGVRQASKNRYEARICANGHEKYLGCFKNIEDASMAYRRAAKRIYRDFYHEEAV
jgi:hypothetical protein